ncbi:MAG: hypothetical protein JWN99_1055, partial [Ilumatobacteraceae bacterium]|nr:hypothetical protein [Ilumatobacteraceae bacterium]
VVTDDYGKELTAAEFIAMVEEITPAGKRHTFDTWPSEGTYLDT